MKFEQKHTDNLQDKYEFEYSYVTKTPKLGQCRYCGSFTKWIDVIFQVPVCSEECCGAMWKQYREDQKSKNTYENFENHFDHVKKELLIADTIKDEWKDILIVVRDQLDYFKGCIESIQATTSLYHLYIWDNGSKSDTQEYIQKLTENVSDTCKITVMRSELNTGFIGPNNEMAAWGDSPYLILLNSDTKVFENWDKVMIGKLQRNPEILQVGYWGGHLDSTGRGFGGGNGENVDYIPGWCFCIHRKTYEKHGLFSPHLSFAYCEDADLSLRIQEAGGKIYALHAPLVHHYQNKTIVEVEKEGEIDVRATFAKNHEYMKKRWSEYLEKNRVLKRQT